MADIVRSAPFCVVDKDYNLIWFDISKLSLDELKDKIPLRDENGNLDGMLGGRVFYDKDSEAYKDCGCTGNGRYITGAEWFGFQETDKGVNYLQTTEEISEQRYKNVIKVRGKNVPEYVIHRFNYQLGRFA